MKTIVLAGGFAALLAGSALASDLKMPPMDAYDAPVRDTTLTGLYFGVPGGAEFANTKAELGPLSFRGFGSNGWFGELQTGYDRQIGNFVIGVYGAVDFSNTDTVLEFSGTEVAKLDKNWSWLTGVRFGYKFSNTLAYVGGGYTQADVSLDYLGTEVGSDTLHGGFAEIGTETRLGNTNIYGKVAGRYIRYASETYDGIEVRPDDLQIIAGFTAKIGN